jgi:sugar phosphate isomerase/epimerase
MTNPRIHLAIDNCFAYKRCVEPREWARIVKQSGVSCVEASADNECDPLYTDPGYLEDWIRRVQAAREETDVTVANLYSGHGTYTVLGLASPDRRNRERILNQWLKVMIGNAARLEAGVGFFCHAFSEQILQIPQAYAQAEEALYIQLAELADYACSCAVKAIGIEQMYSPHQIPWTLQGARKLLREVFARGARPFYLTIDTGHQTGQRRFLRPPASKLRQSLQQLRVNGKLERGLWLGPDSAYAIFREAGAAPAREEGRYLQRVEKEMDRYPYLFASPEDGDPYVWLQRLACYSPIIHLQQTDGLSSAHKSFAEENNRRGIIQADKVLKAIAVAYSQSPEPGMPSPCEDIYLTLELFSETADLPVDILDRLAESVSYWRRYVPKDGLNISELLPGEESPLSATS